MADEGVLQACPSPPDWEIAFRVHSSRHSDFPSQAGQPSRRRSGLLPGAPGTNALRRKPGVPIMKAVFFLCLLDGRHRRIWDALCGTLYSGNWAILREQFLRAPIAARKVLVRVRCWYREPQKAGCRIHRHGVVVLKPCSMQDVDVDRLLIHLRHRSSEQPVVNVVIEPLVHSSVLLAGFRLAYKLFGAIHCSVQ